MNLSSICFCRPEIVVVAEDITSEEAHQREEEMERRPEIVVVSKDITSEEAHQCKEQMESATLLRNRDQIGECPTSTKFF